MTDLSISLRTIDTDVLVVGSGGAGFRAAIGAREKGASVCLISKGRLARSGASPMAGADLTCHGKGMRAVGFFGEPNDSEEKFINDIVHQGSFLNDQRLTELYVKEGPDRMKEVIDWGLKIKFTDERAVFTPGPSIVDALYRQARKLGVDMVEDVALLDLYTHDGIVNGALGLELKTGEFIRFKCKAVVMGTGGWHKAFAVVTGSRELTGDGVAMALRAGAELTDMEFITFACNTIYWPAAYRGSIFTYVLGMLVGGELENADSERIFEKYDPWMIQYANKTEWNKSFISMISSKEIRAGKGLLHGGLRFVTGKTPFEVFEAVVQQHYSNWVFHDGDFSMVGEKLRSGEGVEVGPGAEYFEGGIAVDEHYGTSLPGLYAAGECASSVFGASRVAAATMEMLTSGARAGRSAGEYACSNKAAKIDPALEEKLIDRAVKPLEKNMGIRPVELRKQLQQKSQSLMGPVRTETELKAYQAFLQDLQENKIPEIGVAYKSRNYNKEWMETLDLINMVETMQVCAAAALARKESRGVHFREDYPDVDNDNWLKEIVVKKNNEQLEISTRPVTGSLMELPEGKEPYMQFVKKMMQGHSDTGGHH